MSTRLLIACPLIDDESLKPGHRDIRYRPLLESAGSEAFSAGLTELKPQFLVVNAVPPLSVLASWRKSAPEDRRLLVLVMQSRPDRPRPTRLHGVEVHFTSQQVASEAVIELLSSLEEAWAAVTRRRLTARGRQRDRSPLATKAGWCLSGRGL